MKQFFSLLLFFAINALHSQNIQSPSKKIELEFSVTNGGKPNYSVNYKWKTIVAQSTLGMQLKEIPALKSGFSLIYSETKSIDEPWKPVLGEVTLI
jgi:hypothetical protein